MGAVAIDISLRSRYRTFEPYIAKKLVMALTGLMLFFYVLGHLAGNLQVFLPAEGGVYPINTYAGFLHAHERLLWVARTALLAAVLLHVWSAVLLWLQKRRARPSAYVKKNDVGVTYASRTMLWSGPIIAAFVVFHILHLTTGSVGLGFQAHEPIDAFGNLVRGFRLWPVALAYIFAMGLLCLHLYHGIWSMAQSVGWYSPRLRQASKLIAVLIAIGYISIPLSILAGIVGSEVR